MLGSLFSERLFNGARNLEELQRLQFLFSANNLMLITTQVESIHYDIHTNFVESGGYYLGPVFQKIPCLNLISSTSSDE